MMDGTIIRRGEAMAQVDVRFDPADVALRIRLEAVVGAAFPTTANTVSTSSSSLYDVLWLAPDEWLVVGAAGFERAIESALAEAASEGLATTVDVSANRVVLEVSGPDARALLEFGCAIDLGPGRFGPGSCAQTLVARAGVVLWYVTDRPAPTYRLLVRPSFSGYLEAWLRDAAVGLV